MGSTELRVGAAGHGAALAELGLRIAVGAGDAWAVLRLLDQWRGASLDLGTPGRPRRRPRSWRASWLRSGPRWPGSTRSPRMARTRPRPAAAVAELEVRVRARARRAAGAGPSSAPVARVPSPTGPGAAAPGARRGGAARVLRARRSSRRGRRCAAAGPASRATSVSSAAHVDGLIGAALFALRRLARSGGPAPVQAAALRSLEDAAAQLDRALVEPVARRRPPPGRARRLPDRPAARAAVGRPAVLRRPAGLGRAGPALGRCSGRAARPPAGRARRGTRAAGRAGRAGRALDRVPVGRGLRRRGRAGRRRARRAGGRRRRSPRLPRHVPGRQPDVLEPAAGRRGAHGVRPREAAPRPAARGARGVRRRHRSGQRRRRAAGAGGRAPAVPAPTPSSPASSRWPTRRWSR